YGDLPIENIYSDLIDVFSNLKKWFLLLMMKVVIVFYFH
ncbi:hypothetical protein SEEM0055_14233, partial [Salmonella enterica subsp. enterica serovar Montevideo str. MB110209-0055]